MLGRVRRRACSLFLFLAVLVPLVAGCRHDDDSADAAAPPPPIQHFRSRPDLTPPTVEVTTAAHGTAPGFLFLAPKREVAQAGPMILDDDGQVVWFHPLDTKGVADFRVQRYDGRPVLTWWRGRADKGVGDGYYVIADETLPRDRHRRPPAAASPATSTSS